MLPERAIRYACCCLWKVTPDVFHRLLLGITAEEADDRPDPERFTIREALAHVADWEGVWLERMQATRDADDAVLQGYDEGQWAIDHEYAHSDIAAQLHKFRVGRRALVMFLRALSADEWERAGRHTELGRLTLREQMLLILAHDGYHARQFAEQRSVE